jgi:hypothetical protein
MTTAQLDDQVMILESKGFNLNDWCEPESWVRLRAKNSVIAASCTIWTKGESEFQQKVRFALQIDRDEPFVCDIDKDKPHTIIFAVRRSAGLLFNLSFLCEHRLQEKGQDIRDLSFRIENLKFHNS